MAAVCVRIHGGDDTRERMARIPRRLIAFLLTEAWRERVAEGERHPLGLPINPPTWRKLFFFLVALPPHEEEARGGLEELSRFSRLHGMTLMNYSAPRVPSGEMIGNTKNLLPPSFPSHGVRCRAEEDDGMGPATRAGTKERGGRASCIISQLGKRACGPNPQRIIMMSCW